jgi:hypothetical protein
MMQGSQAKLNPGLSWQKHHSTSRRHFSPANNAYRPILGRNTWNKTLYGAETWTLQKVDQIP